MINKFYPTYDNMKKIWSSIGSLQREINSEPEGITSVNGNAGPAVVLDKEDIGLSNVDNTSDLSKPVSTAQQTQLNTKLTATQGTAQPDSVAADVPALVADFNLLLQNLRDHNIIAS